MTDEQRANVEALCKLEDDELNPWEADFVDSLSKLPADRPLTVRQASKLEELVSRHIKG